MVAIRWLNDHPEIFGKILFYCDPKIIKVIALDALESTLSTTHPAKLQLTGKGKIPEVVEAISYHSKVALKKHGGHVWSERYFLIIADHPEFCEILSFEGGASTKPVPACIEMC